LKVAVTGADGLLGSDLVPALRAREHDVVALASDVTDPAEVEKEVATVRPEWVVHLAAFTRVDDCEAEPDRAHRVNGAGAGNVARAAHEIGASILHMSTDYVFDGMGRRPYREDDPTAPLSAYGRSKLEGEEQVRNANPDHLIVRTSWLYGHHGRCFPKAILQRLESRAPLRVVNDQRGAPTWTRDLAEGVLSLFDRGVTGETFHCTASGECTWFDFAAHIARRSGIPAQIDAIDSATFAAPAPRPAYSVLSNEKFQRATGRSLPNWRESADRYLDEELRPS
jgi:dTDP-4-dehydrorhamnose reductase